MSSAENPSENNGKSSHTKSVFVDQEEDQHVNITGSYVPPNRWAIETKKSILTSGSQASSDEVDAHDLGRENFVQRAAASQTDIDRFQETRIKSLAELKKRALQALERAEKERKERLEREADQESDT